MKSFFFVFASVLLIQLSKSNPIPPTVEKTSEQYGRTLTLSNDELILAHVVSKIVIFNIFNQFLLYF